MLNLPSTQEFWNSYKNLKTWKKILLFLPFVIVIILLGILFFLPKNNSINEKLVKHHKKTVNKYADSFIEQDKELEKFQKKIEKQMGKLQQEAKKDAKEYKNLVNRVNNASNNPDELNRIREELNERNRKRRERFNFNNS
jgi:preprotein translocase subunit SecF